MSGKRKLKTPRDVLGIESTPDDTRLIKIAIERHKPTIQSAQSFPPLFNDNDEPNGGITLSQTPPELKSRFISIAANRPDIIVSLPTISGSQDLRTHARVLERMGVQDTTKYRLGYKEIGDSRSGARPVLAVAFPNKFFKELTALFQAQHMKPRVIESTILACLTAFTSTTTLSTEAVGVLCINTSSSYLVILNNGAPAVIRSFNIGRNNAITSIQREFGVDNKTAQSIAKENEFDTSSAVGETINPLLRQVILSRDFVERHEGVTINSLHVCAPPLLRDGFISDAQNALEIETIPWDPFETLSFSKSLPDADSLKEKGWRYVAALGSALGCLEGNET